MSMCKLHSEFYRQQAKLDALLTRAVLDASSALVRRKR